MNDILDHLRNIETSKRYHQNNIEVNILKNIRTKINAAEEQSPPLLSQAGLLCRLPLG